MSRAPAFVRLAGDWPVKRVRFLVSYLGSGKTPAGGAAVYQSSGVMLLRSQNIQDGRLDLEDVAHISNDVDDDMRATRVLPGDLLLNITGASIGRNCLVPRGTDRANVNQHVCIIRSQDQELGRWLAACFQSQFVKSQIQAVQSGAGREGLNFEQVGNLKVNLPEVQVRDAVLSQLERALPCIDALIEKKTRFIKLLR